MADAKISQLSSVTTPSAADLLVIVENASSTTKNITYANMKTAVNGTWYQDEVLTYSDGVHYTLANTPTAIVFLFLNGQKLVYGTDYTRSGTAITMAYTNLATDTLTASYL